MLRNYFARNLTDWLAIEGTDMINYRLVLEKVIDFKISKNIEYINLI